MSRKASLAQTRVKRLQQTCKVYEVKVDSSKLNQITTKHLNSLFLEAKWLYNHIVASDNIIKFDTKVKFVTVVTPDAIETRKLEVISSQMKQGIKERLFNSIKALSSLKKKGYKVGRLKFRSRLNSISLKQHHNTYSVNLDNGYIKLQGLKQKLKVNGLEQLPKDCEIASANLIRKQRDYYFHIVTFVNKEEKVVPEESIGIDFGCETQLTLSNGVKIKYQVPVSQRLKRLDRKIMKSNRNRSNNKFKDQIKRQKEYQRLNNIKKDIKDKIVHVLTSNYKYVCFQDENIRGWKSSGHGKKIQSSAIGGIIIALKNKAHTPIEVDRFYASTQLCPECGRKNKMPQWIREYSCDCGFSGDRDVKAAVMIERVGVPTERRDFKPREIETSTNNVFNLFSQIKHVTASLCQ